MPRLFHRSILIVLVVVGGMLVWGAQDVSFAQDASPAGNPAGDPVVAAAGDISKCNREEDSYTAYLLDGIEGPILALGDNAYESGSPQEFNDCYGPTWGRHKDRIHPVPGNHEYVTGGAFGYFTYFGNSATPLEPGCTKECKGYYSFDVGTWHLVALNSEINFDPGSEQEQWLRADLAAHPTVCTLAYWHRPRYSSGYHQSGIGVGLWQALYDYGADIVLNGHDHDYERFAPQDNYAQADSRGIRAFIVGTGGDNLRDFKYIQPNSEVRNSETWGVLKLTLHPDSYDWEFIPIPGYSFTDSGSAPCVTVGSLPPAPAAVVTQTAPAFVTTSAPEAASAPVAAQPAASFPEVAALPADGIDYTIQPGDTLFAIALRYGLNWTMVAAANGLSEESILQIGQVIRLPGAEEIVVASAAITSTGSVQTIAALVASSTPSVPAPTATLGVTSPVISAVRSTVAASGTVAAIQSAAEPADAASTTPVGTRYTVQPGDSLFGIALRNGLTWQAVATANGLSENDVLQIGQEIVIPVEAVAAATPASATSAAASPISGRFHTVAAGDTITTIALSYGMDWRKLLSLNGLNENSILQIGQRLRLE